MSSIFNHRLLRHLFRKRGGEIILKQAYARLYGKTLDLRTPTRFSEKLFNRLIMVNRHGNDTLTRLADKYAVREYVRKKVGDEYLVGLIWSGTSPDDIPFDSLPPKCVIKTNHGSGRIIVFNATADRKQIVRRLREWMKENYYWIAREYHYYHIPKKILIEEFLEDGRQDGPLDYRFWCFNGKPEVIQVDNHPHSINPFYDTAWNKLDLSYRKHFNDVDVEKPDKLGEMLEVAATLSSGFDFVRVDLYNMNGKIYFGEMTFTPVAGKLTFQPDMWDEYLGQKWGAISGAPINPAA